ncbi:hypothetical protein P308_19565 [Pseudomonas piscis]|nr:hypothetical protein P308_19565 [Pseudomonas piscis]
MVIAAGEYHRHTGPFFLVESSAQGLCLSPISRAYAGEAEDIGMLGGAVVTPGTQAFFQFVEADHFVLHIGAGHFQATEDRMGVGVDQTWHQGLATQVDDPGMTVDQVLDLRVTAGLQDLAVFHCQGLGLGSSVVGAESLAVEQHQVGGSHGFQGGKTHGDKQQRRGQSFH